MERRHFRYVSASQISTYNLCGTKWYLSKILGLPEEEKDSGFYGTLVHSIAERYLLADDTGRDKKTGKPVDLFPEGWDVLRWKDSKFAKSPPKGVFPDDVVFRFTEEEKTHVRMLVDEAVAEGVWERRPGRRIEYAIKDGVAGTGIALIGYVDMAVATCGALEIHDHKTTKGWRYALSPAKLREDPQMLLYAGALLREFFPNKKKRPATVTLRHNQFSKTVPIRGRYTRVVQVSVPVEEVEEHYRLFEATVAKMAKTAQVKSHLDAPQPTEGACNAYGGCSFLSICGKTSTLERYSKIVKARNLRRILKLNGRLEETAEMASPFQKMRESKLNATKPAPAKAAPAKAAVKTTAKATAPSTSPEGYTQEEWDAAAAPWADPSCKVCSTLESPGFNSLGSPCRICTKSVESRGVPHPDQFDVGTFTWELLEAAEEPEEEEPEEPEEPEEEPEPAPKTKRGRGRPRKGEEMKVISEKVRPNDEWVEPFMEEEEPEEEPAPKTKTKRGKPKSLTAGAAKNSTKVGRVRGLTLFIGCYPVVRGEWEEPVQNADDLFTSLRDGLAAERDLPFYEMDSFRRRDALHLSVNEMADVGLLDGASLFCPKGNSDYTEMVQALRARAETVILGTY